MNDRVIIEMYNKGNSIEYITNYIYKREEKELKIFNYKQRKVILINNTIKKSEVRKKVYEVIYNYVSKKNDRPI